MPFRPQKQVLSALNAMGKILLKKLESPVESYETGVMPPFMWEIVKYNIIGLGRFDYQSMWADNPKALVGKRTDP